MDDLQTNDPAVLDQYTLVGRLGSGGFGIVYLATDPSGNQVAIKVLRSELADDQRLRARLSREARAISAVSGNRTAKVLEVVTDGPFAYLVMEYVQGESLDTLVRQNQKPEGPLLWFTALGLVEALQEIHNAGITHRDLKPSNIIFGPDGVKVVDFGISSITDEAGLTQTGTLMGSAAWLSPEQVTGAATDYRTDIFNLGLVLFYLASGKHAFGTGRPDALLFRISVQQPQLEIDESPLRTVIYKCLEKQPQDRPSLETLNKFFSSGGSGSADFDFSEEFGTDNTFVVQPSHLAKVASAHKSQLQSDGAPSSLKNPESRLSKTTVRSLVAVALILVGGIGFLALGRSTNDGAKQISSTSISIAPPVVATTRVPPKTTTTSSLPADQATGRCYTARDLGGRVTKCVGDVEVRRASVVQELNFQSVARAILTSDVYYNVIGDANEGWTNLGYGFCETMSSLKSYEQTIRIFSGGELEAYEYETGLLVRAAVEILCPQFEPLLP